MFEKICYKIMYKIGGMKKLYYFKDGWLGGYTEYLEYKDKYFKMNPNYCRGGVHGIIIEEIKKEEIPKYSIERDFFENVYYYDKEGIEEKRIISGFNASNDEAWKLEKNI